MSSNIDTSIPPLGNATTAGVRTNFATAKAEIEALQNSFGFANYEDTATTTTPITLAAGVWTNLTNNKLGARTIDKTPLDVGELWNSSTNRFDFSTLPLYTQLTGRFDITVVTGGNNYDIDVQALVGIGSPSAYAFPLTTQMRFATAGTHRLNLFNGMFIGSTDVKNFPASIQVRASGASTVIVSGWYMTIQKPTFS